jgi:hypothetical protein
MAVISMNSDLFIVLGAAIYLAVGLWLIGTASRTKH